MVVASMLLLPALAAASWDSAAVLQKSTMEASLLEDLAEVARQSPRPELPEMGDLDEERAAFRSVTAQADMDTIAKGWQTFYDKASKNPDATPAELLRQAQTALVQTGAMGSLRLMATAAANKTQTQTKRGAVPMDSMLMGFTSAISPWANLLRAFHTPLIKVKFELFANFFGPGGDAGRLCISSSVALDSRYATFDDAEFGGVTFFVGPAKWDNVPGWAFGSSGGFDDMKVMDVADFGWKWTFAHDPSTVMFFWDMLLLDSAGLQKRPALLQTDSETNYQPCPRCPGGTNYTAPPPRDPITQFPTHGSTFFGHTWCSPDWTNTPMVLETPPDTEVPYPKDVPGIPASPAASLVDPEADAI